MDCQNCHFLFVISIPEDNHGTVTMISSTSQFLINQLCNITFISIRSKITVLFITTAEISHLPSIKTRPAVAEKSAPNFF